MMLRRLWSKARRMWVRKMSDDQEWIEYLRAQGMRVGVECRIIDRRVPSEPFLISIGDHVTLTDNVTLLTHDGAIWLDRKNNPTINRFAPIIIKDNCFIGYNSIILPGVTIGPDAVVAAGAVVTRDVEPKTIVGGNPARVIRDVDSYLEKCRAESLQITEAESDRILRGEDPTRVLRKSLIARFSSTDARK